MEEEVQHRSQRLTGPEMADDTSHVHTAQPVQSRGTGRPTVGLVDSVQDKPNVYQTVYNCC